MYTLRVITKKRDDTFFVPDGKRFKEMIQKAFSSDNLIYTSEYKKSIEAAINRGVREIALDMCAIRQYQIDSFSRKDL